MRPARPIRRLIRRLALAALVAALAACARGPAPDAAIDPEGSGDAYAPEVEIVARDAAPGAEARFRLHAKASLIAENEAAIGDMIGRQASLRETTTRARTIEEYAYLRESPVGRRFLAGGDHRALIFGWPADSCPHASATTGRASARRAIEDGLAACFADVGGRRDAAGEACGCRLMATNRAIYAAPADLPWRTAIQTYVLMEGAQASARDMALIGDFDEAVAGEIAFTLDDVRRERVCVGALVRESGGGGSLSARCNGVAGELRGRWRELGLRGGRLRATGWGRAGAQRAVFLFGHTDEDFRRATPAALAALGADRLEGL